MSGAHKPRVPGTASRAHRGIASNTLSAQLPFHQVVRRAPRQQSAVVRLLTGAEQVIGVARLDDAGVVNGREIAGHALVDRAWRLRATPSRQERGRAERKRDLQQLAAIQD